MRSCYFLCWHNIVFNASLAVFVSLVTETESGFILPETAHKQPRFRQNSTLCYDQPPDRPNEGGDTYSDIDDPFGGVVDDDEVASANDDEDLLGYAIDSFLRGEYDRDFAEDAPAPHPGLSPGAVVSSSLRSLRNMDDPEPAHGAAVMLRFCLPLRRGDRWGDASLSQNRQRDAWKDVLRGALTPSMFARRLRASEFACLLDWTNLDVTEGAFGLQNDLVGIPSMAFVNAALYFEDGIEPVIIQFTLRRIGGVWLIDTARKSARELFATNS